MGTTWRAMLRATAKKATANQAEAMGGAAQLHTHKRHHPPRHLPTTTLPSATLAAAGSSEADANTDDELGAEDHSSHASDSKTMIIQRQCGVTSEVATSALHDANGDLADAVMSLIGQGMVDDRVIADAISS